MDLSSSEELLNEIEAYYPEDDLAFKNEVYDVTAIKSHPHFRTYDLRPDFAPSRRLSIKRCGVSLGFFCLFMFLHLTILGADVPNLAALEESPMAVAESILLGAHFLFLVAEFSYWEMQRAAVRFFIRSGRLHIRRGVFLRTESSASLATVTEFYISQSHSDMVLGLCSFHILTPMSPASGHQHFTKIEGLTRKKADRLLCYLDDLIKSQNGHRPI
jgi:hypothetical protein